MAGGHLLGHEIDDLALDVEVGQRDGGDAVGLGEELCEFRLIDEAQFGERIAKPLPRLALLVVPSHSQRIGQSRKYLY